ncbi:MAG: SGNH/GDSL hydrolase family protein [Opitutales bacterium]
MDRVRVVLIGDSIRMGYESTVRTLLGPSYEVITCAENGRSSETVLARLDEWALAHAPQLVHLNCGLHDLRRDFGANENAIPPALYANNLRAIFEKLQAGTAIQIVWAQTTPVNEAWHHQTKDFDRREADVDAYNRCAQAIAAQKGIQINDLHRVIQDAGRDRLLRDDGVHFTPEGSELLGQAVAEAIQKAVSKSDFRGA